MAEPPAPSEQSGAVLCRLQYLEDADPFSCAAFPEPRRPPVQPVLEALPLAAQVPAFLRLLGAPLRLEDCALQVSPSGHYLDLELSLLEQKEELEGFYEDLSKGRRPILLLRTQLSVRVHAIMEKLYRSQGPELRRSLFSLKQLFQEDKDLVPEFVNFEGLTCLISVGAEADQNYQNYILRALGQILLFVDGMMGVIRHPATVQWLYTLTGSLYRLVVKSALKLLLVFVEFAESNAPLLIRAVAAVEQARGGVPWSRLVALLEQKNGADTELQVFAMTLINKTLAALPDQDSFYDVTDCLEQQGMERLIQLHLSSKGADPDLKQQLLAYENALKEEDDVEEPPPGARLKERRRGEECRQGPRRSLGSAGALEESRGACPSPAQTPSPEEESSEPPYTYSSASSMQLSAPLVYPEGEQLASLGERSVFKTRFLENLAASQREKMLSIHQGRAEILAGALPHAEQMTSGRWKEARMGSPETKEPGSALPLAGGGGEEEPLSEGPGSPHALSPRPEGRLLSRPGDLANGTDAEKEEAALDVLLTKQSPSGVERTLLVPVGLGLVETGNAASQEATGGQADLWACPLQTQASLDAEASLQGLEKAQLMGGPLGLCPKLLKIRDLDFSDLDEEEEVVEMAWPPVALEAAPPLTPGCPAPPPPAPPPPVGIPAPPPPPPFSSPLAGAAGPPQGEAHSPAKKKTIKLFWRGLRDVSGPARSSRFGEATLWASLEKVKIDSAKLEHLFESKAKEVLSSKKAADGRKLVVVLDPKRSNAINIGLTVLPPIHVMKTAILGFDEFAINKEGIEKILTMVPTEEEKQKIQEAQLANPNLPLGSAEQFLLTLSSIPELAARLQLWAFKLDYETMEQEIAEPLFDLKLGMEQLAKNQTFRCILATLLAMGNFLNGSQSQGFELDYLAKVSEVKDTVHRQSLLHHLCHIVVEKFPASTDLYSEIAALTRSAKVDFEELAEGLLQLERRCQASWDNLKAIAKHDCKPALKSKLVEFLRSSSQKIFILKTVHWRVLNRFRSFLLFLGYNVHLAQTVRVTSFCQLLREFALEYRTCRERVLQQRKKRAVCRERSKTRGRMITEMEKFAVLSKAEDSPAPAGLSAGPESKAEASHRDMTSLLASPAETPGHRSRTSRGAGKQSPTEVPPRPEEAHGSPEDASEEIVDRLVKSVTHSSPARPGAGKERRRSRANRKSLRRTLKNGLSAEVVQALGLAQAAGVAV